MEQILVVDDDKELCELLVDFLEPEGFVVEIIHEPYGGLRRALSGEHCLVILDVMLPGMTGFELLKSLRKTSQVPVLMLTARGEEIDCILGLEMGADDYLAKPFNPRELSARIHAIQRRTLPDGGNFSPNHPRISIDDLELDMGTRSVKKDGLLVKMTAVEFSLLYELVRNVGRVMTRDELTRTVLHRELEVFDRSIDVHISSLRKKLGHQVKGRERIKTLRSVGYLYTLSTG